MDFSPAEIVRKAWRQTGLNQSEFAAKYGIKQYNLSRYAKGKVKPPEDLLMQCMHIIGMISGDDVTSQELVELIQRKLSRPEHAVVRRAVYDLLSNV